LFFDPFRDHAGVEELGQRENRARHGNLPGIAARAMDEVSVDFQIVGAAVQNRLVVRVAEADIVDGDRKPSLTKRAQCTRERERVARRCVFADLDDDRCRIDPGRFGLLDQTANEPAVVRESRGVNVQGDARSATRPGAQRAAHDVAVHLRFQPTPADVIEQRGCLIQLRSARTAGEALDREDRRRVAGRVDDCLQNGTERPRQCSWM